jgi:PAS domain S-box-containing protein
MDTLRSERELDVHGGRARPDSRLMNLRQDLDGRPGDLIVAQARNGGDPIDMRMEHVEIDSRELLEVMTAGVIVFDSASVLTYVNRRFTELLGYTPGELIGRPLADLICPINHAPFSEWEVAIRNGRSQPIEVVLFKKAGGNAWVQFSLLSSVGDGSERKGRCVVVTDIGHRIRSEAALRRSNEELRTLSTHLVEVQERERQRIATDLHDGLGQSLTAMKYGLEQSLCKLRAGTGDTAIPMLETLLTRLKDAVGEVRRVAMNARPSTLDDLGIVATLSWLFREFETIYPDIKVRRHVDIDEHDVLDEHKVTLYRIAQEAMNNLAKHAHATAVSVSLRRVGDALELVVSDNGCGFDPQEVALRKGGIQGMGLASIRDRAMFAGGTYVVRTAVGQGVEIRVRLPVASCAGVAIPCAVTGCGMAALPAQVPHGTEKACPQ